MWKRTKTGGLPWIPAGMSLFVSALFCIGLTAGTVLAQLDLSVFQKEGVSEEQQSKDRYECHGSAVMKTDFDPSVRPPSDTPPGMTTEEKKVFKAEQSVEWRKQQVRYNEALSTCMQKRGYTVADH